ncbi:MAG: class I SAM-dependent methyltransferase [Anaerolineaceae bacterium]|nr:class I SAM-dependent methyltransferase [Anaerolineaceae bacterium]
MGLPIEIDNKAPHELYEGIEYRDYWTGVGKLKLDELEQYLVRDLLPTSGLRIIDLGCGYGRLSECYARRYKEIIYFDGSISLLKEAREKTGGNGFYIAGSIYQSPFKKGTFNAALMVRVFHHLADSRGCLSEINRILGAHGVLVFNYSNKRNISRLVRWAFNRKIENPLILEPKLDNPWFYPHHPAYIHRLLIATGYTGMVYRGAGIIDKIADKLGPFGMHFPNGRRLARIFAALKIAPWIFCYARSTNGEPVLPGDALENLLQCPACRGPLLNEFDSYICQNCFKKYPVLDHIIDFRIP